MGLAHESILVYTCDREGCPTTPLETTSNMTMPQGWIQISFPYPQRWICSWLCLATFAEEQSEQTT